MRDTMTPKELVKAREKLEISQAELAENIARTVRFVSYLETGARPMRRETKMAICLLFIPKKIREKYIPKFMLDD